MNIYRMYHEEMESLVKHIPTIKKAQFWMTFSDNYLKHLEVLQNVGMTRIDEVEFNGQKIVPLQFLKAVLPDPGSLGPLTKGKTCIGVIATRDQGRQAQAGLHLQHLRPRGVLPGGQVPGHQLHHRRAGGGRRHHDADRQMARRRASGTWSSSIRSRSWRDSGRWGCRRSWLTAASGRSCSTSRAHVTRMTSD